MRSKMTKDNLLIKNDLIDYANTNVAIDYYSSRKNGIKSVLPDTAEVEQIAKGGYQGVVAKVSTTQDGYIWLMDDYYGSCSMCDGLIGEGKTYIERLLREARCFSSPEDAIQYIRSSDDFSFASRVGSISKTEVIDIVRELSGEDE